MTQISTKIKLYANREVDFSKDVKLQDNSDGKGVFIAEWNLDIPKPTMAQLDDYNTAAELSDALQVIRTKRNQLITETDYLALSDNTLSEAMSTYRQALRDITNGITTIEQANSVTWPTKP